jgi:hypothetical protein
MDEWMDRFLKDINVALPALIRHPYVSILKYGGVESRQESNQGRSALGRMDRWRMDGCMHACMHGWMDVDVT